ncbi:YCF48-related protein [Piscinibacter sp. XHJ-5]|uniref:WD40/YVTN/BNR-like repeat-containing protein n=1 Tax=Piscinibacter sp. XHJ-5 TaxID=3037797 RepID=UPI002452F097|nr:YCF48-related protein [Piscinibacter sp. XHJ-5]
MSSLAARSPLLAAERAGDRVVAVGHRGHIVYSDDSGATWRQAAVPVSVDLLGISFPSPRIGWAVGHGGVVLATRDGGATWTKQLAGKQAAEIARRYYQGRSAPTPEETRALAQAEAHLAQATAQPFLDVQFENETSGFVVGAFNTILRTEDGGKTWVPWMDRTSNAQELHFYAVRGRPGRVFLAGEQGKVWRLQASAKKFVPVTTSYTGTFFGLVVADPDVLLAFGMRGSVWRSPDEGATWQKVSMNTDAGITAGAALPDGRIALVDQGGSIHISLDGGRTFVATRLKRPVPCYGVAPGRNGNLVLTGPAGAFGAPLPWSASAPR